MRRTAWLFAFLACAQLCGCELVADFDRSKIPTDAGDGPLTDSAVPQDDAATPVDSATPEDATTPDEDSGSDEDAGS